MASKYVIPHFPIEKENPINTLAKPLIIESAFPGWLPISVNPNIPIKRDAVAREIIESVKAGAAAVHIHPRDPNDGHMLMDSYELKDTLDRVFQECPDVFTWNHTWVGGPGDVIDYLPHTKESLDLGNGPLYCEGSVVLIKGHPTESNARLDGSGDNVRIGVPWLEEHGVKPIFQLYDTSSIHWLIEELIEPGLVKWKPFMCCVHLGKHHASYIGTDPWSHLQMITSIHAVKTAIPDSIVGIRAGGRNWLPITATAIAMGVDMVGVGMEDCLWMYPHKDEIIAKNSEVIRKVATIAKELGRDIATPADVRRILNTESVGALEKFNQAEPTHA